MTGRLRRNGFYRHGPYPGEDRLAMKEAMTKVKEKEAETKKREYKRRRCGVLQEN